MEGASAAMEFAYSPLSGAARDGEEGAAEREAEEDGSGPNEMTLTAPETHVLEVKEEPKSESKPTPLPTGPILSICVVMLTNSLSQSILYPFAAVMVRSFNVAQHPEDLGYYTGFLASAAFLGSLLTNPFWGSMSDRYGRKKILLVGLLANLLCSLMFGASTSYFMAITARFINGLFTTIIATGRSFVAELCDSTNQAQGFAWIGTCTGLGLIIGPAIGGFLCLPAEKYPGLFPKGSLFDVYPFFLPCFCLSILCSFSFVASVYYLPETLGWAQASKGDEVQSREKTCDMKVGIPHDTPQDNESSEEIPFLERSQNPETSIERDGEDVTSSNPGDGRKPYFFEVLKFSFSERDKGRFGKMLNKFLKRFKMEEGLKETLREKDLIISILFYGVLSFCTSTFNEVFPLWCITPWDLGGLGIGTDSIAIAQTACGVVLIPLQQLVYAPLVNKIGAVAALRSATFVGLVLISFPLVRLFGEGSRLVILGICVLMAIRSFPQCVYTSVYILMSNGVKDPKYLGTVNGVSQSVNMIFRATAPTLGGCLFAWSTGWKLPYPFDANMWFLWLGFLYAAMLWLTYLWTPDIDRRKFVMSTNHPQYSSVAAKNRQGSRGS